MKKSQSNYLKMYKHLGLVAGQAISPQSFGNLQYTYLSPAERRDKEQIIKYAVCHIASKQLSAILVPDFQMTSGFSASQIARLKLKAVRSTAKGSNSTPNMLLLSIFFKFLTSGFFQSFWLRQTFTNLLKAQTRKTPEPHAGSRTFSFPASLLYGRA